MRLHTAPRDNCNKQHNELRQRQQQMRVHVDGRARAAGEHLFLLAQRDTGGSTAHCNYANV